MRAVGDRLGELVGRDFEAPVGRCLEDDRLGAGEADHLGIRHPIGGGKNGLVAGLEGRQEGFVEGVLAAARDDDL